MFYVYPEKFIRDSNVAAFLLISVVILYVPQKISVSKVSLFVRL